MTHDPLAAAAQALDGRRERALLDEPSVASLAGLLASRCRQPAPWVRAAVGTLGRFATEVADGDLAGLLTRGRADHQVAQASLELLRRRHDGRTASQVAALAFGPKLWWRLGGVPVAWRPLATDHSAAPRPAPAADSAGLDARLILLALIGTGVSAAELLGVRASRAGSLDSDGALHADPEAEPLAFEYVPEDGGPVRLSFLSYEARAALLARRGERRPDPDEPLLLPAGDAAAAREVAAARSAALISAGNDVNVATCRATGDFFRAWGMPGARFEARTRTSQTTGQRASRERKDDT